MSRRAWTISLALVLWPIAAAAQPASSGSDQTMLGMRLFNQSCRVCHTKPQLAEPAIWAGAVDEYARRQGRRHARDDQQRHAAHAGLQISLQARRDRRHRRLYQNHSRAVRRAAACQSRLVARRRLELWRTPCAAVLSSRTSLPSPRFWFRCRPLPTRCSAAPSNRRTARPWAASRCRPSPTAAPSPRRCSPIPTAISFFRHCPTAATGSGRRRSAIKPPKARSICRQTASRISRSRR